MKNYERSLNHNKLPLKHIQTHTLQLVYSYDHPKRTYQHRHHLKYDNDRQDNFLDQQIGLYHQHHRRQLHVIRVYVNWYEHAPC